MSGVWGAPPSAARDDDGEAAPAPSPAAFPTLGGKEAAFPTLGAAAAVKTTKKKAKQTMSLADFNAGAASSAAPRAAGGGSAYRAPLGRSMGDDDIVLPTGPRARDDDEEGPPGIGGAFRDYGGDRGGAEGGRYGAWRARRRRKRFRRRRRESPANPKQAHRVAAARAAPPAALCCAPSDASAPRTTRPRRPRRR
jgi:hypothetical protein